MVKNLKIALAQLNLAVGDLDGNLKKMLAARKKAIGADLVVFPELSVTGYPPEDLVLKKEFQNASLKILEKLKKATSDKKTAMLVGCPYVENERLYNAAFLLMDGKIIAKQYKHDLPNYGVFDEKRVFSSGLPPVPVTFKGIKLGIMICEDMWNMKVAESLKNSDILVSINASPYEIGKHKKRLERAGQNIKLVGKPLIYVNQICGQDDLVFDGDSFVLSKNEEILAKLSRSNEEVVVTEWEKKKSEWICKKSAIKKYKSGLQVMYQALMLGLSDYVKKNNFPGVVIGMSGGVDSAITAAVAVDALGKNKVRLVMMPSKYTEKRSIDDARKCAEMLGVRLENIPIIGLVRDFEKELKNTFKGTKQNITEENIQSRARGVILMAISNKFGHMVLSTGNKSEMAVGYATLYGDMCGGYSVLKDVYKTEVYELVKWRNNNQPENSKGSKGRVIPDSIIKRAPTAELRPNQKDQDSLPPYEILDDILKKLIEREMSIDEVVKSGHDIKIVKKVFGMVYGAEYKRRQSPPGVKVSVKPFGRDRRYPITNAFKG